MSLICEGAYYFLKIMIGFEILQLRFQRKNARQKWILLFVGIISSVFHSLNVAMTTHVFSNTELFIIILLVTLAAVGNYDEKVLKIIGGVWFYFVFEQLFELLLITVFSIGNISNRNVQILLMSVLLCGVYLGIKRVLDRYPVVHLNFVIIYLLNLTGSMLIIFFQRVYLESITEYILSAWKIWGIYTFVLLGFFVLYGYVRKESLKYKLIKEKNELLEKSYQNIFHMYKANSRIFHDYNAHLYVLRKYLQENETRKGIAYIDELIKPNEKIREYVWTNCEIIDLIINIKRQEAKDKGILIEVESDVFETMKIPETDICAIFSNLLDNAIENCKPDKGKVELYIKKRNEILILIIRNPIVENVIANSVKLLTIKRDKGHHGIGLDSVRYSVERNNGSFEYDVQNGIFEAIVTLPN